MEGGRVLLRREPQKALNSVPERPLVDLPTLRARHPALDDFSVLYLGGSQRCVVRKRLNEVRALAQKRA